MTMMVPDDLAAVRALADLAVNSPFSEGREKMEATVLGAGASSLSDRGRVQALSDRARALVERMRSLWAAAPRRSGDDLALYEGLVRYYLADRLGELLQSLVQAANDGALTRRRVTSYRLFEDEAERLLDGVGSSLLDGLPRFFAVLLQRHQAVQRIEELSLGTSPAAADFRQALWLSIFTRDLLRYERVALDALPPTPMLVQAPLGSELRALVRVLAQARPVAFDEGSLRFTAEPSAGLLHLHAGALSDREAEAELLGVGGERPRNVERASKTLQLQDGHMLVLEEIEQLSSGVQARLAQALSNREAERGATGSEQRVQRRLVAVSTGDLRLLVATGRLREDLYYQLCGDVLRVPALSTLLRQAPEDLPRFVDHVLRAWLPEAEVERARDEVVRFIERVLPHHPWPGNFAELAQCARSVLVRGGYQPPVAAAVDADDATHANLAQRFLSTDFDADGLLDAYCTLMYKRTGSYQEAARRLGLDRRTVKSRVDEALLAELS